MKERPILFSAPMVRAILDGRKTQTRRVVKGVALDWLMPSEGSGGFTPEFVADPGNHLCPYGVPGDRLWVRETWALVPRTAYACSDGVQQTLRPDDRHDAAVYAAGWERCKPGRWRPSIHMPRWASRITLEITGVRVERLNDCSLEDACAEGWPSDENEPREWYATLWEHINGPGSWDANPWVWAVEFRRAS